jgi:hypothetical protein
MNWTLYVWLVYFKGRIRGTYDVAASAADMSEVAASVAVLFTIISPHPESDPGRSGYGIPSPFNLKLFTQAPLMAHSPSPSSGAGDGPH